jgi:SAM-dependent methyltransferase
MEEGVAQLFRQQLALHPDAYLQQHSRNRAAIRRHIQAFKKYQKFIPGQGKVLDWGCNHALDACLIKMALDKNTDIYGCDVGETGKYEIFHQFANLNYTRISHIYKLPYPDNYFDAVVGSGVLEHVPNDQESLKEIYRILKPYGHFIVTFLPNSYSYIEFRSRALGLSQHLRLYSLGGLKKIFLHSGFWPVKSGYHGFLPTLSSGIAIPNRVLMDRYMENFHKFDTILEQIWGLRRFSQNIFIVGKKMLSMEYDSTYPPPEPLPWGLRKTPLS